MYIFILCQKYFVTAYTCSRLRKLVVASYTCNTEYTRVKKQLAVTTLACTHALCCTVTAC